MNSSPSIHKNRVNDWKSSLTVVEALKNIYAKDVEWKSILYPVYLHLIIVIKDRQRGVRQGGDARTRSAAPAGKGVLRKGLDVDGMSLGAAAGMT